MHILSWSKDSPNVCVPPYVWPNTSHHPKKTIPSCCGKVFQKQALGNWSESKERWLVLNTKYILEENLHPSAFEFRLRQWFAFQKDINPKHTAKAKQRALLEWPSESPDFNPTVNLWLDLNIAVHKKIQAHLSGCIIYVRNKQLN
uniref:Uncharacterized protein n=1 Tax=Fundulus heteroclitus TaxID=8078 RepID=A0A3Q2SN08_FUNHE